MERYIKMTKERELDIPEFLKGQTKEYIRMEKTDYKEMIAGFNQTRHLAFMRGVTVGAWSTAIIAILAILALVSTQYFSFGTLPIAGP